MRFSYGSLSRRGLLMGSAGVALAASSLGKTAGAVDPLAALRDDASHAIGDPAPAPLKNRIHQSTTLWSMKLPLEKLAAALQSLGLGAVDLVTADQFADLKKVGLVCSMTQSGASLKQGFGDRDFHAESIEKTLKAIDATAEAGFPNVICFSGNRNGKYDDEEGAAIAVAGLKKVVPHAEKRGVTLCMEVLNSRLNHPGYMCDTVEWGAKVCQGVGSPRMKLLFDIYHVQVQQGDVIARIRQFKDHIGHYHTAGVPGRKDLDERQELFYPAIMRAILETGFTGYVAHEFSPKNGIASLRQAVALCDV